jgi:hypothetical protein
MSNNTDDAKALIADAQQNLTDATSKLNAAAPESIISTPAQLDAALQNAPTWAVLRLASTLVYPTALTLIKPVTLQAEIPGTGRIARESAVPTFLGGLRSTVDDIVLTDLAVRHTNPLTDIVVLTGARSIVTRVRVLGDPVNGGKRGFAANGSAMVLDGCHVGDIFQPAQDTQAVCTWNMPGTGLTIRNCYLEAAGQSVMAGGADSDSAATIPTDLTIVDSELTKNPAWYARKMQIKCALELKDSIKVRVFNTWLRYAGTSMGQGAYLIVVTPRNQGGKAPWSTVRDVVIENCFGQFAAGIVTLLGSDNINPSGPLADFTLRNFMATDIDPLGITGGTGRLFAFDRGPARVTLDGVKVTGKNLKAHGYFSGVAPVGLVIKGMDLPPATYKWKIDAGGMGRAALMAYMPDAQIDSTVP